MVFSKSHCKMVFWLRCLMVFRIHRKCKMHRETLSGRATPGQWAKYIVLSTVIRMMWDGATPMAEKLRQRAYINNICPGRATFSDRSRLKIGRQSLPNRLDFFSDIKFDWTRHEDTSTDRLRIELKKTFITTTS